LTFDDPLTAADLYFMGMVEELSVPELRGSDQLSAIQIPHHLLPHWAFWEGEAPAEPLSPIDLQY
jgi:hypothetical protein